MSSQQSLDMDMEVVTSDGAVLGRVKDISEAAHCFRVDCRLAPDLYVPRGYVRTVDNGKVILQASKEQVPYLGWELKPETY